MIYVSSACLKNDKIFDTISELAENGIYNIELSGGTRYYENIEKDLIYLKEKYRLNYACHSYFPPPIAEFVVNLASGDIEIYNRSLNHYLKCVDMLERVGISTLSIHAGFLFETNPDSLGGKIIPKIMYGDEAIERFVDAYHILQYKCKMKNITLYLENNVLSRENLTSFAGKNLLMMTDSCNILKLLDLMDFNLLLDLAHLNVSCKALGLDFEKERSILLPYARWFHISENDGFFDQHKPIVENSIMCHAARAALQTGYNITLETKGSVCEILKSIEMVEG